MTGKKVIRHSPKYARDGAKKVHYAIDRSSKVRDLIRGANYICIYLIRGPNYICIYFGLSSIGAMLLAPGVIKPGIGIAAARPSKFCVTAERRTSRCSGNG